MKKLHSIFLSSLMTACLFFQQNIKASTAPNQSAWTGSNLNPGYILQSIAPQGAFQMYTNSFNWFLVFSIVIENKSQPGTVYISNPGQIIWRVMNNNQYQMGNNTINNTIDGSTFIYTNNDTQFAQMMASNKNWTIYGQTTGSISPQYIQSLLQQPGWSAHLEVVFILQYQYKGPVYYFYTPIEKIFSAKGPNAINTILENYILENYSISPQAVTSWVSATAYQAPS